MKKFVGILCALMVLIVAPAALGKSCASKCYDARVNSLMYCMFNCEESFRPGTASRARCIKDCKSHVVDDYRWCKNLCKDRY